MIMLCYLPLHVFGGIIVPPSAVVSLSMDSVTCGQCQSGHRDLPMVRRSVVAQLLGHNACVIHLTSSHPIGM